MTVRDCERIGPAVREPAATVPSNTTEPRTGVRGSPCRNADASYHATETLLGLAQIRDQNSCQDVKPVSSRLQVDYARIAL